MADLVAVGRRKRTEMEAEINTLKNESEFMQEQVKDFEHLIDK